MEAGDVTIILQACFVLVLLAAAVSDIRTFQIPDALPFLVIALFVGDVVFGQSGGSLVSHMASMGAAFVLGLIVFRYRIMAGGDVKLITAVALWISVTDLYILLTWIALAGGVQAALIILIHLTRAQLEKASMSDGGEGCGSRHRSELSGQRVPYGVAIAAGAISTLLLTNA